MILDCRDLKCENILLDQENIVKVSGMLHVKTAIMKYSFTQQQQSRDAHIWPVHARYLSSVQNTPVI